MSILINMEMPKSCFLCEMCYQDQDSEHNVVSRCAAQEQMEIFPDKSMRNENCPLVEIKPHGRLIDADALKADCRDEIQKAIEWEKDAKTEEDLNVARAIRSNLLWLICSINNAPTIIEEES